VTSLSGGQVDLAIEAAGLGHRYGRRWALVDVSLRVERGRVLVVAGRNGSGKSTLLRVLATAIRADRGQGRVLGHDLKTGRDEVRRQVALLSHYSYHYDALTPTENLRIAVRFLGRDASRAGLLATLHAVGLAERADDPVATFSAGMRKRLALARVLVQEATVLLLDEPYAALDPQGFRLVDDLIARWRAAQSTVLLATHLVEHGASLADEGLVLEAGRTAWTGAAAQLGAQTTLSDTRGAETHA
jgi:heme exporter protein A